MKHLIIAATTIFGLACVGGVSVAQDQTHTTNMQDVTVTQLPAPYDIYIADLGLDYKLEAVVGNTHGQYVQARRAVDRSEALRMRGLALRPLVSVAIDNSSGPGVARQIRLINSARDTVAIVNVYCKRSVPSGGAHCKLAAQPMRANTNSQRLASTQMGQLQLVEVGP